MAGGGACGLLTAMLLAKDGHEVVVLERDPAPPPPPAEAWDLWERRGVSQFRLPHGLLPRFHQEAVVELPGVVERMRAEGAYITNMLGPDGPPEYVWLTGTRPFAEACIAAEAQEAAGVDIRRGVAVAELVAGPAAAPGTPHVAGVQLESGDQLTADLVIDAGGRRSALPRWLTGLGARPAIEEREDSGFVYYGTHFRSTDGHQAATGPVMRYFGSIAVLALPGERGTWGVGLITGGGDAELRCLKNGEIWRNVLRGLPESDHLLDGKPLHEIRTMSAIEDRYRRYVVEGAPVATGVISLADAVAATNPTRGRGIAMGLMHGIGLRDTLRKVGLDDHLTFSTAFDEMTETVLTPHYRATVWDDRHQLAEVEARRRGEEPDMSDEKWIRWNQFVQLAARGGPLLPRFFDGLLLFATPDEILDDPEVQAALAAAGDIPLAGPTGPSRAELLELARS